MNKKLSQLTSFFPELSCKQCCTVLYFCLCFDFRSGVIDAVTYRELKIAQDKLRAKNIISLMDEVFLRIRQASKEVV